MKEKTIYKVVFSNRGQIYQLYARKVSQGNLYGFIVIEELTFGENSSILVDPSEEKLRREFEGVERSFIPMHEVIRIDQVKTRGVAKIIAENDQNGGGTKVTSLYVPEKK